MNAQSIGKGGQPLNLLFKISSEVNGVHGGSGVRILYLEKGRNMGATGRNVC